jgi:hypothetical protein
MLIQAGCTVHIANKWRINGNLPFILMALYVNQSLCVDLTLTSLGAFTFAGMLTTKPTLIKYQVQYNERCFNLYVSKSAFDFIHKLYNFRIIIKKEHKSTGECDWGHR